MLFGITNVPVVLSVLVGRVERVVKVWLLRRLILVIDSSVDLFRMLSIRHWSVMIGPGVSLDIKVVSPVERRIHVSPNMTSPVVSLAARRASGTKEKARVIGTKVTARVIGTKVIGARVKVRTGRETSHGTEVWFLNVDMLVG